MEWYKELCEWYKINKRDLPWRESKNPYYTWISEVILQQTRVAQGLPYYYDFIDKFPTVQHLASASEGDILIVWQGLGYYSRARNLHQGAKDIVKNLNGNLNQPPNVLLKIKGIGPYTANAIASLTYDYPVPVVDGNVYRVISRFFGIEEPVPSEKARKIFTEILLPILEHVKPSDFNQGLMELGALICSPTSPKCENCPLSGSCFAFKKNSINRFPVKLKKKKPQKQFLYYLVFESVKGKTVITKRTKGTWIGLHEFPLLDSSESIEVLELTKTIENEFDTKVLSIEKVYECKHQLTHRSINASFLKIKFSNLPTFKNLITFEIELDEIHLFPVHRLMKKYLDTHYKREI